MRPLLQRPCGTALTVAILGLTGIILVAVPTLADTLVLRGGERIVGRIVSEEPARIVVESVNLGRVEIPRDRVQSIEREGPALAVPVLSTNAPEPVVVTNTATWSPFIRYDDKSDWIELKSGEWLKGELKYIQNRKVNFESDKLENLTFKLKDVRQLHTAQPMFAKFEGHEQVYGSVVLSNETVEVVGPEQLEVNRDLLTGITPGGDRERSYWSGKLNIGMNLQSGNTHQVTIGTTAELARRTPATQFLLDYTGNYAEARGAPNANNQRVNATYDVRLNRHFFARPVMDEYYRDPLANLSGRYTVGIGAGYYIFDRDDVTWLFAVGPAYQYDQFETVEPGNPSHTTTAAGLFQTRFNMDITSRLTLSQTFSATVTSPEAGRYSQHFKTSLEYEIKHHLDLNISFIWDYLQNPQTTSSGTVPLQSDFYLTLGLGMKF